METCDEIDDIGPEIGTESAIADTVGGLNYSDLCWAYVDDENKNDSKKGPKEDYRTRQRRLQTEYSQALATLRIKSVTFHTMIYQNDPAKVILDK